MTLTEDCVSYGLSYNPVWFVVIWMVVLLWVEFYSLSSTSHWVVEIRFCSPGGFCSIPPWSWRIYLTSPHRLIRENSFSLRESKFFSYFLISLIRSFGYDLINLFVSGTLLSLISVTELQSYRGSLGHQMSGPACRICICFGSLSCHCLLSV